MTKVSGQVKLADGSSVGGVTVEVINSAGDIVDQTRTTDDGSFTYFLSPGSWTFNTYDATGRRGKRELALGSDDFTASVEVHIG
jgi:hypothetical protein